MRVLISNLLPFTRSGLRVRIILQLLASPGFPDKSLYKPTLIHNRSAKRSVIAITKRPQS